MEPTRFVSISTLGYGSSNWSVRPFDLRTRASLSFLVAFPTYSMAGSGDLPMDIEEPVITVSLNPAGSAEVATPGPVTLDVIASRAFQPSSEIKRGPGCHPDFTGADRQNARALEPAFESMPRQAEVCEDVVMAIRLQEIHSRQLFVALDRTEEGFCDTCKEAFHVDPSRTRTIVDGVEHSQITKGHESPYRSCAQGSWRTNLYDYGGLDVVDTYFQGKVREQHSSVTVACPVLLRRFRRKTHGWNDDRRTVVTRHFPCRGEGTEGKTAGKWASTWTAQHAHNSNFVSTPPANMEELRTKYKVMTDLWLLVQMREPGRRLYADLDKDTFSDCVDELISEKNFLLERRINGVKMVIPQWEHCLNYTQELRNEAIRLTMEEGFPIKSALWAAYRNEHHRNEHWVMLIGITNAELIRGGSKKISQYEQRIQKLEQQLAQARSRSPKRNNSQVALPGPAVPALPSAASAPKSSNKKGKGKGKQGGKNQTQAQPCSGELLAGGVSEVQPDDQQSEEAKQQELRRLLQVPVSHLHRKPLQSCTQVHRVQQKRSPVRRLRLRGVSSLNLFLNAERSTRVASSSRLSCNNSRRLLHEVDTSRVCISHSSCVGRFGVRGGDRGGVADSWQRVRRTF